jgi:hypothetical protein
MAGSWDREKHVEVTKFWRSSRSRILRFRSWLVFMVSESLPLGIGNPSASLGGVPGRGFVRAGGVECLMQFEHDRFSFSHCIRKMSCLAMRSQKYLWYYTPFELKTHHLLPWIVIAIPCSRYSSWEPRWL